MTVREIVAALSTRDVDTRVQLPTGMVLDLFVEVEALRGAMHSRVGTGGLHVDESLSAGKSPYQASYLNKVYTSNNSAGPSSGMEKVLATFYASRSVEGQPAWRECLVLRRLGFTEEEVARYVQAASEAETFT